MRCRRSRSLGFTLIELMTVSVILAVVVGGIFATFTAGQRSMAVVDDRTDLHQVAWLINAQLTRELRSLYVEIPDPDAAAATAETGSGMGGAADVGALSAVIAGEETEESIPPLRGEAAQGGRDQSARVEFLTILPPEVHEAGPRVQVAQVGYYVDLDSQTAEQGLVRTENRYPGLGEPAETTTVEVISELVVDLQLQYYDPEEGEWVSEWDSETPPRAVLFTLTVDDPNDKEEPLLTTGTVTMPRQLGKTVGESLRSSDSGGGAGQGGAGGQSMVPTGMTPLGGSAGSGVGTGMMTFGGAGR